MFAIPKTLDNDIQAWGDSLTENSAGGITEDYRWPYTLGTSFTPARSVENRGVGGESAIQIRDRLLLDVVPNRQICIFWAGRNGVLTLSPDAIVATIATMVASVSDGRWVVVSVPWFVDGTEPVGSSQRNAVIALNTTIQVAWPDNYVDVTAFLEDPSTRSDGLHLSNTGSAIVRDKILALILAKGW